MSSLPHILIMSSWYPTKGKPFLGNFVKRHAELIATKYPVSVLNIESNSAISQISVEVLKTGNLTEIFVEYPSSSNPLVKWRRAKKAFRMGVQHIREVDLIHASSILSKGYQFLWAKKHFKKPLIVTEHGSYYRSEVSSKWSLIDKQIIKSVLREASIVTAVSPFLKSEIENVFPKLDVRLLPNVVNQGVFKFKAKETDSKVKFIHISTLDERFKNISGIIEACDILSQEISSNRFELQIVSDEPYQKWKDIVAQKGLDNYIQFSGPLQSEEIAEKIQDATALILFSNYETFSVVIAEAWATGTPVISTPVGIAKDLDEAYGIQVEVQNVSSLVKAMRKFIHHEVQYNTNLLQSKSKPYAPESVLEVIDKLYQEVLK